MKTVQLEANKVLNVLEQRVPEIADDECLVKIKICGVCSSDIYRAFENGSYFYPLIMGHEISGQISKVGEKVNNFIVGDDVSVFPLIPCFRCQSCKAKQYATCSKYKYYGSRNSGGFSEYIAIKEWNLININSIGYKNGAFLEPLSVVVHGLKKSSLLDKNITIDKRKICVIGAGFLGLLMSEIIFNKLSNCEIHILDRNQFKLDYLSSSDRITTHCLNDSDKWEYFIESSKNSFDYIFELSGNESNFSRSILLSKSNSKILWLGNIQSDLLIEKSAVSSILRKELQIIGSWNSHFKHENDDWLDAIKLIEEGYVNPSKYITQSILLDELPLILKKMYDHKKRIISHPYIKYCISNL
ncbi:MAG: hypothetical protein CMD29_04050 [Flavobacteriales bacterium]|nr:hypothetical protein [Flavobacteriales bacterium]|tara:strand:- start:470 stop:1540 length:1071 start_codon:yes stop_codon:yes gene_type:complete